MFLDWPGLAWRRRPTADKIKTDELILIAVRRFCAGDPFQRALIDFGALFHRVGALIVRLAPADFPSLCFLSGNKK
jgi:hypothetical protein